MLGWGMAMWLARRAAVRQSRVRIPPGTPPLVQPRKIQEQKSIGADFSQRSRRRFQRSSRRISPSPRMNIVSASGFWPRVRARALRAPVFLGLLTRQTGRCAPPHRSFAAPSKIKKTFQKQNFSLLARTRAARGRAYTFPLG